MLGVMGLLTGWVLLLPLIVLIYLRLGGPYHELMAPFLGIAVSVPMLGFSTIAGIVALFWSVRRLTRQEDPLEPPRYAP